MRWTRDARAVSLAAPAFENQVIDVKFRVELVWQGSEDAASSIFLTSDGRVILQGRAVSPKERTELALPPEADMISVDRTLIRAIKDML
jgi:hypothetical protein